VRDTAQRFVKKKISPQQNAGKAIPCRNEKIKIKIKIKEKKGKK